MTPPGCLTTTDGRSLEIIDPGLANRNAGPDFFNAKVRIDGVMWVGNVEIHERSADWYMHCHDRDAAYNNVVLHVARVVDTDVVTARGDRLPQLQLDIPPQLIAGYRQLMAADALPPCRDVVTGMSRLAVHSWLSALLAERMSDKTEAIHRRVEYFDGSWEEAFFATIARSFGFGVNSEAFEQWAACVPLAQVAHHRDDAFQVEALFMGVAGLLDPNQMSARQREAALADSFFVRMKSEYDYLSLKFHLKAMSRHVWRFLRLRPQNFPYIRLSQLATLYCSRRASIATLTSCATPTAMREALQTSVGEYWRTHYTFGSESRASDKQLSAASRDLLIVNAVVPMLHAWGVYIGDDSLTQRAIDTLETMPPEDNTYIRMWKECGIEAHNAADTQALLQLQHRYCERKDCLRCRFGYYYLKGKRTP